MRILTRTCCMLAMLAQFSVSVAATKDEFPGHKDGVKLEYFGLHIHRLIHTQPWLKYGDIRTAWPEVKFGSWRLWDAYVAWPNLEPEPGKWNFSTLDRYVDRATEDKVQILLPLGLSPAWASARPQERSGYRPGNASEPANMDAWRNYVLTVAQRYKGRIRHYEIWNEVNYKDFYSGSQESLVELTKVAYQTLKEVDSANVLVSPSVVGEGKHLAWFDDFLAKGGGKYADIISYHFYVPKGKPEDMVRLIDHVRRLMQKHGLSGKPLWNTETGWAISNQIGEFRTGAAAPDWKRLSSELAVAYVARALIIGAWSNIDRFYWYAWDNIDMGLIEAGSGNLKPAAHSYGQVVRWLHDSRVRGCLKEDVLWSCELEKATGERQWIMWVESGESRDFLVPKLWRSTIVEDLGGRVDALKGASIRVGQSPVLVREVR